MYSFVHIIPFFVYVCECLFVYMRVSVNLSVILFTNPSARAGYDTRSIF